MESGRVKGNEDMKDIQSGGIRGKGMVERGGIRWLANRRIKKVSFMRSCEFIFMSLEFLASGKRGKHLCVLPCLYLAKISQVLSHELDHSLKIRCSDLRLTHSRVVGDC